MTGAPAGSMVTGSSKLLLQPSTLTSCLALLACPQRWRLAEIRLEDYAFVALSRIAGKIEEEVRCTHTRLAVMFCAVCHSLLWHCRASQKRATRRDASHRSQFLCAVLPLGTGA